MEKRIEPLSPSDRSFIKEQLKVAYYAIAGFCAFLCAIAYFVFDKSLLALAISFLLTAVLFFLAKQRISKKIDPILQDNQKVIYLKAEITNKDIEMESKKMADRDRSTFYYYVIFIGEERIDIGMKNHALYEVGDKVNVEFTQVGKLFLKIEKSTI
jgi:hypothetical protein